MSATASILSMPSIHKDWVSYLWFAPVTDDLSKLPSAPSKLSRALKSATAPRLALCPPMTAQMPTRIASEQCKDSECLPLPCSVQANYRLPRFRNVTGTITKLLPVVD